MDCQELRRCIRSDHDEWINESRTVPRITLTYAQSIDGSIAEKRGKPTRLSGDASMEMTHLLRTLHAGILVGVGTVAADNPSLTARLVPGPNPTPIVLDTTLRCPLDSKLLTSDQCIRPIILCSDETLSSSDGIARKEALTSRGAKVISCHSTMTEDHHARLNLRDAFQKLYAADIQSVMVEGGASILAACLQESATSHLVDRVIVTIAPVFIGGLRAADSVMTPTFPRLQHVTTWQVEQDVVISGKLP